MRRLCYRGRPLRGGSARCNFEGSNNMRSHGMTGSLKRQLLFPVLMVSACLLSCDEEDRTVKLTCNHAIGGTIPIHLTTPEPEAANAFQSSAHNLSPGTILRLTPGGSPVLPGSIRMIYILKLPVGSYAP